jgi:hypothetical protein
MYLEVRSKARASQNEEKGPAFTGYTNSLLYCSLLFVHRLVHSPMIWKRRPMSYQLEALTMHRIHSRHIDTTNDRHIFTLGA